MGWCFAFFVVKYCWQQDLRATVWPYHLHLRITALAIGSDTVIRLGIMYCK
ncbi:hypothetical protein K492DRAFT_172069 [Lichtheimia hyalospora FSU 10163]|nr:hypothetical protein K492DRAFT_172069 [Lichtheimia hyalospora FSU 10163]